MARVSSRAEPAGTAVANSEIVTAATSACERPTGAAARGRPCLMPSPSRGFLVAELREGITEPVSLQTAVSAVLRSPGLVLANDVDHDAQREQSAHDAEGDRDPRGDAFGQAREPAGQHGCARDEPQCQPPSCPPDRLFQ